MDNKKKLPKFFSIGTLILANGAIVIALMHLTFHFIDSVNFAVGFLENEVTSVLMLLLSIFSALTASGVIIILNHEESKSYFFRKVAFITFWICVLNILIETVYRNMLWFFISMFTILNSVFCNGLVLADG